MHIQNCVDDKFPPQLNSIIQSGFFLRFFSFSTDQKSFQGLILTDISDPENLISSSGLPFNQHICFICHKTTDYEHCSLNSCCALVIQYSSDSMTIVLSNFGKKNTTKYQLVKKRSQTFFLVLLLFTAVLYLARRQIGGHKGAIMTFDFSLHSHIPPLQPRAQDWKI